MKLAHEGLDFGRLAHVAAPREDLVRAGGSDFLRGGFEPPSVTRANGNPHSRGGEPAGDREPDPPAATGDER
jgi:hypothetical protein